MENTSQCLGDFSTIYHLETKFREILAELQFKNDALENSRERLTESQNLVCKLQISLDNEKRKSYQLQQDLKNTVDVISRLDDEKIRGQSERARLELDWNTSKTDRVHLLEQVKIMRLENVQLKQNIEMLEANLFEKNIHNQTVKDSLVELRNQFVHLQLIMSSNLEKLKGEQENLKTSMKSLADIYIEIEDFGQRIFTSSRQDKKELEHMKQQLAVTIVAQSPVTSPTAETSDSFTCQELREFSEKFYNSKIDKKLDAICDNLHSISMVLPNDKTKRN